MFVVTQPLRCCNTSSYDAIYNPLTTNGRYMISRFLQCLVLIGASLTPIVLLGSSQGQQSGRTARTGSGCGGGNCHGSSASTNTIVRFKDQADSLTVMPGSTTDFTVVVNHDAARAAGVDIAVKTTETGGMNAGTLQAVAGEGLGLNGLELTHITPKAFTEGVVSFSFKWVAPTEPGVYFLRAIANAVNLDGTKSAADHWNWAPVLRVRVSNVPNGVHEYSDNDPLAALGISPMPAHDVVTLTTPATPGSMYTVNVLDLTGSTVFVDNVTSSDNVLRYVWNGTTSAGIQALPGSYVVAVSGNGSVKRGRAVIVR